MKPLKTVSSQAYTLLSSFDEVRQDLLSKPDSRCLTKPLSYWALPHDRRLPYALLGVKVEDVLRTPFAELSSTPGIGPKKIASLVMLLNRALHDKRPFEAESAKHQQNGCTPVLREGRFDSGLVSESHWEDWQKTVRRHQLEQEKLGRFAPSLRRLPTVIWNTRLASYLGISLADLRHMKTHGEKRVCTVLEVFCHVHQLLGGAGVDRHFSISLQPSFVPPIEQWIQSEIERPEIPTIQEVRHNYALPLLNQIEIDAGEIVHRLVAGRLGIESEPESVRVQAHRLGVTRARVYQLLDTCADIMNVRWPDGRWRLAELAKKFQPLDEANEQFRLLETMRSLAFPEKIEQPVVEAVPA